MRKFLCYDTVEAARGEVPVTSSGLIKAQTGGIYIINAHRTRNSSSSTFELKDTFSNIEEKLNAGSICFIKLTTNDVTDVNYYLITSYIPGSIIHTDPDHNDRLYIIRSDNSMSYINKAEV